MLIKLNIDGELLELLKADAEENCRTNPQQILYYLKQIYKGKTIEPKVIISEQIDNNDVLPDNQESTIDNNRVSNVDEYSTNDSTNMVQQQKQEDYDYIDDDMIGF